MARQNRSKVGRLEDEQRKHEEQPFLDGAPVDSRDDRRRQQAAGDGEPDMTPGRRPITAESVGGELSIDGIVEIADFTRWCEPAWFPTTAGDLQNRLATIGAPAWAVARLDRLDTDFEIRTPGHAWRRTQDPV